MLGNIPGEVVVTVKNLCARAEKLGNKLTAHLSALRATVPAISDVRGLGCMVAVEFAKADGTPDADFTKLVQKRAQDAGLLLLTCGVYGNVIRFLFPLTIEDAVLDEGLATMRWCTNAPQPPGAKGSAPDRSPANPFPHQPLKTCSN